MYLRVKIFRVMILDPGSIAIILIRALAFIVLFSYVVVGVVKYRQVILLSRLLGTPLEAALRVAAFLQIVIIVVASLIIILLLI